MFVCCEAPTPLSQDAQVAPGCPQDAQVPSHVVHEHRRTPPPASYPNGRQCVSLCLCSHAYSPCSPFHRRLRGRQTTPTCNNLVCYTSAINIHLLPSRACIPLFPSHPTAFSPTQRPPPCLLALLTLLNRSPFPDSYGSSSLLLDPLLLLPRRVLRITCLFPKVARSLAARSSDS